MAVGGSQAPGLDGLRGLMAAFKIVRDPRTFIDESARRFGPVWTTRIPDGTGRLGTLYWMMGAAANERILALEHKDDFTWYGGYRFTMEPLFGRDILFLTDDTPACPAHRDRHRLLAPAFRQQLDERYLPLMEEIVERRIARWPSGIPFDLQLEVKQLSFSIVARLFFGADDDELPGLLHDFEEMGPGLFTILRVPIPGTDFWRGLKARKRLAQFLERKIRQMRARNDLERSVLGQLLSAGELPERSVVDEMLTFLFAGYDTTASLLTSLFAALGEAPAALSRVVDEARALPDLSPASLAGARQIDLALLEAERLYPPLVFAMRGVVRPFRFLDIDVPAGALAAYSAYYTGRDRSLWSDPLAFRPERFEGAQVPPFALLGFGGGHRLCIGKRFARVESALIIAAIYRRFTLELLPRSPAVSFNPTLQRTKGVPARATAARRAG
jgi:cytochrome P450